MSSYLTDVKIMVISVEMSHSETFHYDVERRRDIPVLAPGSETMLGLAHRLSELGNDPELTVARATELRRAVLLDQWQSGEIDDRTYATRLRLLKEDQQIASQSAKQILSAQERLRKPKEVEVLDKGEESPRWLKALKSG